MKSGGKYLITGGGTGGHIFPAIAIADALRKADPACNILFVGAEGRMEMTLIPQHGYEIKPLQIRGFNRKNPLANFGLPYLVSKSVLAAITIIRNFKPDVIVGVGGYVSGPVGAAAVFTRVPLALQEQNSYAGVTNRILGRFAKLVCVAYPGMEVIFGVAKTKLTGNPVRDDLQIKSDESDKGAARKVFGLDESKPAIFITGGSLGAESINSAVATSLDIIEKKGYSLLWMCGKSGYERYKGFEGPGVKIMPFVESMKDAYTAADLVISRAGALSISELACQQKACILVPSPNVTDDHQTKNAKALADKGAALVVKDNEAKGNLMEAAILLIENENERVRMMKAIATFARPKADDEIAQYVMQEARP